jgi:hypothetical protein
LVHATAAPVTPLADSGVKQKLVPPPEHAPVVTVMRATTIDEVTPYHLASAVAPVTPAAIPRWRPKPGWR